MPRQPFFGRSSKKASPVIHEHLDLPKLFFKFPKKVLTKPLLLAIILQYGAMAKW